MKTSHRTEFLSKRKYIQTRLLKSISSDVFQALNTLYFWFAKKLASRLSFVNLDYKTLDSKVPAS